MQLGKRFPVRRKDADKVVEARRGSFAGAPCKGSCEGEVWNVKLLIDNVRSSRGLREQGQDKLFSFMNGETK